LEFKRRVNERPARQDADTQFLRGSWVIVIGSGGQLAGSSGSAKASGHKDSLWNLEAPNHRHWSHDVLGGQTGLTLAGMRPSGRASAETARRAAISNGCLVPCHAIALLITVIDGHPATLAWLGGVAGHRTVALGVEHFGQTGTIDDLYCHFGIDTQSIVEAASDLGAERPIRHLGLAG